MVPLPTGQDGYNRLDQIYAQIRDLQKFKDEIMDDLDDFMEEVETNSLVTIPEQFDEVVDIIANEQRERGEQIVEYQELHGPVKDFDEISQTSGATGAEILDDEGKPFWMKFFKADYLGESKEPK